MGYKGHFTFWQPNLTQNLNENGEITKNWKFDKLNWKFFNFEERLQK